MIRDYNRIIESLDVRFVKAEHIQIVKPVGVTNIYDIENTLVLLRNGTLAYEQDQQKTVLNPGDVFFIPEGKSICAFYGTRESADTITNEQLIGTQYQYLRPVEADIAAAGDVSFSYVNFSAKIFNAVGLFASLDIPAFLVKGNTKLGNILHTIFKEQLLQKEGANRIINIHTIYLAITLIRHLLDNKLFAEKLSINSNYFKDIRLVSIFKYIKANLDSDLSNKVLARVGKFSEDYVGQYFKNMTGINPQDYIEYQRLEQAVRLLKQTPKSIQDISRLVGYKDTAYFCRRFKLMFGISAGKLRRRELFSNYKDLAE